jgi:hypothetical protein
MTFKHIKFEDSSIMRSLERVAQEKGLVKPTTVLEKIASRSANKKLDVIPTSSMMDNIFKLTAGLRSQGLIKEAAELESNYFNYKQAQTLYEAHKEKGEDVIQFAHPKGSHKLEGVEGDEAIFEDILDKHVKFLKMIEKKPTGKLSSSAHILSEVKKALAAPAQSKEEILAQIRTNLTQINSLCNRAMDLSESEVTVTLRPWRAKIDDAISSPDAIKIDNLKKTREIISHLIYRLKPGYVSGISEDTWVKVSSDLNRANNLADQCIELRAQYNTIAQQEEDHRNDLSTPMDNGSDLGRKIAGVAAQYIALATQLSSDDPKDASALEQTKSWLRQKSTALQQLASSFQNESDKNSVASVYQATLTKYVNALAKIQKEWT